MENSVENSPESTSENVNRISFCAGVLCIDNYEEVRESLDEGKWPLLAALIDRKLAAFAQSVSGILSKYEKDRYSLVITCDALEALIESKFEILDQIREICIGNTVLLTLSIGIGNCGETPFKSMECAKYALELALGRGGDQAVIKDESGYRFFGAKTAVTDRSARVRARVKSAALMQLISDSANVYVLGHVRPDLDALGAAIGIYVMALQLGKKCVIVMNEPNPSIQKLYEKLSEVQKYNSLFVTCEKAIRSFRKNSLLVVVDTHRPSVCECPELVEIAEKIVIIDHHRRSPEFIENCALYYQEPSASSASELVAEMLRYFEGGLSIKPLEADALLAGIAMDSKNFSIKTNAQTFEAAAFLRRCRADTIRVKKLLQNDMETLKARSEVVKDAQIFMDGIAISVCPHNIENASLVAAMSADELLNVVEVQASFVLTLSELHILISARSLGEINVQRIMERLGGGGHRTVAGAQLPLHSEMDMETAVQMIKDAALEYLDKEN